MLTKKHLNFKISKGSIYPNFLDTADQRKISLISKLIEIFCSSKGKALAEIEARLQQHTLSETLVCESFKKLLHDRSHYIDTKDLSEKRWEWILKAQELRLSRPFKTIDEFYECFQHETLEPFQEVSSNIYNDLPMFRVMETFDTISEKDLIHRYNCAQIQGQLIKSNSIKIFIGDCLYQEKRTILKQIKFHRLLYTYEQNIKGTTLLLTGPHDILDQKVSYGLRIANFFPHVLNLSQWTLEANIKHASKDFTLSLSNEVDIKSHYKKTQEYIPVEFADFISRFNEITTTWVAHQGDCMIDLKKQIYIFPDIVFKSKSGKKVYLEIFHKWHRNKILQTTSKIEKYTDHLILVGICRSVGKKTMDQLFHTVSPELRSNILLFRDFPSVKSVYKILEKSTQT